MLLLFVVLVPVWALLYLGMGEWANGRYDAERAAKISPEARYDPRWRS